MSHTPGPWIARFNSDSQLWEIDASPELDKGFRGKVSWTLAIVLRGRPNAKKGEAIANAHLLAAAPVLLEVCSYLTDRDWFKDVHSDTCEVRAGATCDCRVGIAIGLAKAAIAAAKGGTDEI